MPRVEVSNNKNQEIEKLEEEINQIDLKRIRAICEPEEKEPGLSWLDYYTNIIKEKREQIQFLRGE